MKMTMIKSRPITKRNTEIVPGKLYVVVDMIAGQYMDEDPPHVQFFQEGTVLLALDTPVEDRSREGISGQIWYNAKFLVGEKIFTIGNVETKLFNRIIPLESPNQ